MKKILSYPILLFVLVGQAAIAQNVADGTVQASPGNGNPVQKTDDSAAGDTQSANDTQIRPQSGIVGERSDFVGKALQNVQTATNGNGGEEPAQEARTPPAKYVVGERLTPRQERLKNLLQKNPFGTVASSSADKRNAQQNAEQTNGLELRSIYCVDGKWRFSISDSVTKTSYTIKLREPMSEKIPYMIDFYDDETNTVSISNNLSSFTLTLKTQDAPTGPAPKPAAISLAVSSTKSADKNTANSNKTVRQQTQRSQFSAYRNR